MNRHESAPRNHARFESQAFISKGRMRWHHLRVVASCLIGVVGMAMSLGWLGLVHLDFDVDVLNLIDLDRVIIVVVLWLLGLLMLLLSLFSSIYEHSVLLVEIA